jgi:uncharacterized protein with GYD domain
MPTYVLLSKLTPEGRQALHEHPDRLESVNRELTRMDVNVIAQFALLGPYDFLTIVEASDNETVAHLSIDLGSRGTLEMMTLPAITISALTEKLHGPQQLGKGPVDTKAAGESAPSLRSLPDEADIPPC